MQSGQTKGPKRWLVLLLAGILLFAGGGGTGYMLGQQQAKAAQTQQMKKGPSGMSGKRPSGKPSGMPSQSSSSN
ncbi:MAG TPA: hypothetical protein H9875_01615 [Candidatus Levilactobacillus faecigallinarum]|uniref:Uncharacterized protein n=1 Tax=Candidatus Levilactobacillus faecigallinarum TaxID=2838638 RepID=A0A9D1QS78_9LACO|nr:hypothetical protein [Candidatus Levilactobacillus faecigallinarum]